MRKLLLVLGLVLAVGCPKLPRGEGEGEGEAEGEGEDVAAAVRAYAAAECAFTGTCLRFDELNPVAMVDCVEVTVRHYLNRSNPRRPNLEAMAACAPQMEACNVDLSADSPCRDVFPGPSELGDDCDEDIDCRDLSRQRCVHGEGATCGTCSLRPGLGDECSGGDCDFEFICDRQSTPPRCIVPPQLGEACNGGFVDACATGSFCQGDANFLDDVADGVCAPIIFQPGDVCRSDCTGVKSAGLRCADGRCELVRAAGVGESCEIASSDLRDNPFAICVNPTENFCNVGSGGEPGVCVAFADIGESCAATRCRNGVCRNEICVFLEENAECDGVSSCSPNLYCDGTCKPRRALGEACGNGECVADAFCIEGVCVDNFVDQICREPAP
jgi:hypothetical protein